MKKSLLLVLLMVTIYSVFGQASNIVNAWGYMEDGALDKAKEAIDKAAVHEKTKEKTKTWLYRGDIYYRIFSSENPEYKALVDNPAQIAFESYKKTKELYPKDKRVDITDIDQKLRIMQNIVLNRGVADYNEKKYEMAFSKFKTAADISLYQGGMDSLAAYNCALASEKGGKVDRAVKWYRKCIELNYRAPDCCNFIYYVLYKDNREDEAIAQVKKCRTSYPNNYNLILTELNYLLKSGDYAAASKNLEKAIELDPFNKILYFSMGTAQENQGFNQEAIRYYTKAIDLDSNYFDAYYNLGALYFNEAVEINNLGNNATDAEKADEYGNKAIAKFKKAIPYLEKARSLKPKDKNTLNSLLALYARIGDDIKYQEIKELLNN